MEDFIYIAANLSYVVLAVTTLLIAKLVKDLLTPFKIEEELTAKDNPALGLAMTGYFAAVIIVYLGAILGDWHDEELTAASLARGIAIDMGYAIGGILALNVGRVVVDRFVLHQFSTVKEIIEDRNAGTGAVEFGSFIATGLIVAGALHGEGGGPWTALAFFGLGQAALVGFGLFYQLITRYDVHAEIERDNVAAGVALGTGMIAIGIVLLRAVVGDFVDWAENLSVFGYYAAAGFALLMIMRKVTDFVLMPGTTLAHEIANDRNLNAAMLEGIVVIGVSSVLFFTL